MLAWRSSRTGSAQGNVITLTGYVRTWAERDAVVGAVVIDMRDELQVTD